jgi:hypothetical protein
LISVFLAIPSIILPLSFTHELYHLRWCFGYCCIVVVYTCHLVNSISQSSSMLFLQYFTSSGKNIVESVNTFEL